MGGYLFLTSKGKEIWRLNLGGAIVWYGLLEELGGKALPMALLEKHNWGEVWDAAGYRDLSKDCIRLLTSSSTLPPATESYRLQRKEPKSEFRAHALRVFRDSMQKLPRTGQFISVDDLNMDWLEEQCGCQHCRAGERVRPDLLRRNYLERGSSI